MARQVLVRWAGDPIGVWTFDGGRPLRVGPGANADVVLPVAETVIDRDGEEILGRFAVCVITTDDEDAPPRTSWRPGRGAASVGASVILHAALFAMLLVGATRAARAPGGDDATNLATMKGYLSRIADRGVSDAVAPRPAHVAAAAAEPEAQPESIAPARASMKSTDTARATVTAHTDTGGAGRGTSGATGGASGSALKAGDDWRGTYVCAQGQTDLVLRVTSVHDADVRAVFDFTHAPTGVHGSYRMHGRVDAATGNATLVPEGWIEQPPRYVTVGMHGRVAGGDFSGTITNETCGTFALHRRT